MNSKSLRVLIIGILVLMIIACGTTLYIPTIDDSQRTGVSADTLVLGRNLYVNTCGSCHNLHLPGRYSQSEWAKIMPLMQKKAKCTNQETVLIMNYLKARAKQN